jgi:hypothetical protein
MFAVRPAMLLLALGLLSLPPAASARLTAAEPTGTPRLSLSCPVDSPTTTPAEFDNPADLSQRVFRRLRLKADIEEDESDRKVAETDFGPVSTASGFHPHTSIDACRPVFPRTCPLRC